MRRPERHAGLGHPGAARLARGQGDAEIGHQRLAVVQHHVLGLDVPVDHAVPVRVVERRGHLGRDSQCVGDRELLLPDEPVAERFPFDERHDIEEKGVGLARIEQRQDVRVLQVGGGSDFAQEALGADDGGELRPEHLDRHPAVVLRVLREEDRRHATLAHLALEAVAVGERDAEAVHEHGHGRSRAGDCRQVAGI